MLSQLTVRNLAIVEEVSVSFQRGLNIITGETGAGKSVLMGALHLVLGGRADKSAIREGTREARVQALFQLRDTASVDLLLGEAGLPPCEEGQLLVRRTLSQSGSGRCYVNDTASTLQTLRKLGSLLVDIHGPYDQQSLLNDDFQRDLLDAYGASAPLLEAYRETWQELRALQERQASLQGDSANVALEIDRLRFIVDEISQAALTGADEEELVLRHSQAANAEAILASGGDILSDLTDGEGAVFDRLVSIQNALSELTRILPDAAVWRGDLQNAAMQVQEVSRSIQDALSQMDADPQTLEQLDTRLSLVQRLKRKYGRTVAEILERCERSRERLADLSTRSEQLERIQGEIDGKREALLERGKLLSSHRIKVSSGLARAITAELRDLGFLKAGFDVSVLPLPEPVGEGLDRIEFGFAPNPGEPMRPLKSIASSGEIARVMLAVKAVLSTHDRIPILVFDEIDANIGGEVGRAVGEKLRGVGRDHQVLCITHLPQSAVFGDAHFRVCKRVENGRTRTEITRLTGPQRVDEIARMLGGKGLTSVVEEHARELLAGAGQLG